MNGNVVSLRCLKRVVVDRRMVRFFFYIRDYEFGVILIIRELIERQFSFVHFFFIELYKFDVYSLNRTIDVILRFNIIVIHK